MGTWPREMQSIMGRWAALWTFIFVLQWGHATSLSAQDLITSESHHSSGGVEYVHDRKRDRPQNSILFFAQRHDWNLKLGPSDVQVHFDYRLWIDRERSETLGGPSRFNIEKYNLFATSVFGDIKLKIGNQEVTWGESPNISILDLVNPRYLAHPRGFYDPAAKIPQFMANIEWQRDDYTFQALLIPWPEAMRSPREVNDFGIAPSKPYSPGRDGEFGFKAGKLLGDVDTKLYFLHHWPRVPSYVFLPMQEDGKDIILDEVKQETFGASASYASSQWIARADLARHNKYPAINISQAVERTGLTQGILGGSWTTDSLHSFGGEFHFDLWDQAPTAYSDTALVKERRGFQPIYWVGGNAGFNIDSQKFEPQVMYLRGVNKEDEAMRLIWLWNATDHLEAVFELQRTDAESGSPKLLLNRRDTLGARLTWSF